MSATRQAARRAALALALAALMCIGGAAAGSLTAPDGKRRALAEEVVEMATDRVIVQFKKDVVLAMAAEEQGLQFQKPAGLQGALVYTIRDNSTVEEKIEQLSHHPDTSRVEERIAQLQHHPAIALVEPDYKVKVFWDADKAAEANAAVGTESWTRQILQAAGALPKGGSPNDPNLSQEWHLPKISVDGAWARTTGSADIKVCHVDSGVRVDHPDLAPNILKGWNFVPPGQVDGTPPPRAGTPDYFNFNDTYGHGTHTAGIIGAVGNNAVGIAGLNWNIKLLVCRFIWNDGSGYVSDAMNCIKLCKQEGALITSNSWGGIGYSSFLEKEIAGSQEAGQLFVVASGNSGVNLDDVPLYPTSYKTDNMISVASSGKDDFVSSFSNIGSSTVHMLAPGEGVYSTYMDGGYKLMWGTSMACPMVAGAAALLQAQAMASGVELTYGELKSLIIDSVDKVDDGKDKVITGGRLNVTASVLALDTLLAAKGVQPAAPATQPATTATPVPTTVATPSPSPAAPAIDLPAVPQTTASRAAVCGTSPLANLDSAVQSSTAGNARANRAVDGKCGRPKVSLGSCSQTQLQANPWWVVKLPAERPVLEVAIQTASECACVRDLVGARIMVGSTPWIGPASSRQYSLCAVLSKGISRGQRLQVKCAGGKGVTGQYIAVWRPSTSRKQLTLCEVDAVLGPAPVQSSSAAAKKPSRRRRLLSALGWRDAPAQ